MKRVITIGGATHDIFFDYQGADSMTIAKQHSQYTYMLFASGEKIEIENLCSISGGGATNTAISFKRLGFNTACFCAIGPDYSGGIIRKELENENVDTQYISVLPNTQTGTSCIINSHHGERTIFTYRGANSFLPSGQIPFDALSQAHLIYVTSLSNQAAELLHPIAAYAKQRNISIAINPGSSQLTHGMETIKKSLPFLSIIIMNALEAKQFMFALTESGANYKKSLLCDPGQQLCPLQVSQEQPYLLDMPLMYENLFFDSKKFFKTILATGVQLVVITNGANGVYVATPTHILFHPSIRTKLVNTVGAGDAFGSCFVGSLQLGYSVEDSLRRGILNSASVLSQLGAKKGLLTTVELDTKNSCLDKKLLQRFPLE